MPRSSRRDEKSISRRRERRRWLRSASEEGEFGFLEEGLLGERRRMVRRRRSRG